MQLRFYFLMVSVLVHLKHPSIRYHTFYHFWLTQIFLSITLSISPKFWPSIPPHSYGNSLPTPQKLDTFLPIFSRQSIHISIFLHSHLSLNHFHPILVTSYSFFISLGSLPTHHEILSLSRDIPVLSIFPFFTHFSQNPHSGGCDHNYLLNAHRSVWNNVWITARTSGGKVARELVRLVDFRFSRHFHLYFFPYKFQASHFISCACRIPPSKWVLSRSNLKFDGFCKIERLIWWSAFKVGCLENGGFWAKIKCRRKRLKGSELTEKN